jgi:hypothetical protein
LFAIHKSGFEVNLVLLVLVAPADDANHTHNNQGQNNCKSNHNNQNCKIINCQQVLKGSGKKSKGGAGY